MRKTVLIIISSILTLLIVDQFSNEAFAADQFLNEEVAEDNENDSTLASHLSRPDEDKGPTQVNAAMWVMDIDSINSSGQNFVANVFVVLRWKDPRLAGGYEEMRTYKLTEVWNPRIQIANEIGLVRRTFPEVVDVEPDGTVIYRQRFVGPFSQPLNLNDFPFDKHTFGLQIVSPGNGPEEIEFRRDQEWIDAGVEKAGGIAEDISLPDWFIESYDTLAKPYVVAPGVEVAGFTFEFVARRDTRHYIWKVILPLFLIVMMSWTVFWIDPSNAGTQIAVATTSMLTLIAYRFAIDSQIPRVPYMTKIDQFIVVATVLVFLCLMQVLATSRLDQIGKQELARQVDRVSRVVFPIVFIAGLAVALTIG